MNKARYKGKNIRTLPVSVYGEGSCQGGFYYYYLTIMVPLTEGFATVQKVNVPALSKINGVIVSEPRMMSNG
jgi:hypothetical protein